MSHIIVGTILVAAVSLIASGSGIGGGAILIPINLLVLKLDPREAVALSNVTIFAGALVNLVANLQRRHPLQNKPLIDWNLVVVMEPLTVIGARLGGFANKLFPGIVTLILMTLLLTVVTWLTARRAANAFRAETEEIRKVTSRVSRDGHLLFRRSASRGKAGYEPPEPGTPSLLPSPIAVQAQVPQADGTGPSSSSPNSKAPPSAAGSHGSAPTSPQNPSSNLGTQAQAQFVDLTADTPFRPAALLDGYGASDGGHDGASVTAINTSAGPGQFVRHELTVTSPRAQAQPVPFTTARPGAVPASLRRPPQHPNANAGGFRVAPQHGSKGFSVPDRAFAVLDNKELHERLLNDHGLRYEDYEDADQADQAGPAQGNVDADVEAAISAVSGGQPQAYGIAQSLGGPAGTHFPAGGLGSANLGRLSGSGRPASRVHQLSLRDSLGLELNVSVDAWGKGTRAKKSSKRFKDLFPAQPRAKVQPGQTPTSDSEVDGARTGVASTDASQHGHKGALSAAPAGPGGYNSINHLDDDPVVKALLSSEAENFVRREARFPWRIAGAMAVFTLFVASTDILKAVLPCGGWKYWAIIVLAVIPTAILWIWSSVRLIREATHRERLGIPWAPGDIHWSPTTVVKFPVLCSVAGIVAGAFGVGGGIVKGPLMLELGVLPPVASATSATMILMTSFASSAVYVGFDLLPWRYVTPFFVASIVGTTLGQWLLLKAVKQLGRPSLIIWSMSAVTGLATILMLYRTIQGTEVSLARPDTVKFGKLCGGGDR